MPSQGTPYLGAHLPKVQDLLDQGKTHVAISIDVPVSTRTISRWAERGTAAPPFLPIQAGIALDGCSRTFTRA